jgi:hypothetical protein
MSDGGTDGDEFVAMKPLPQKFNQFDIAFIVKLSPTFIVKLAPMMLLHSAARKDGVHGAVTISLVPTDRAAAMHTLETDPANVDALKVTRCYEKKQEECWKPEFASSTKRVSGSLIVVDTWTHLRFTNNRGSMTAYVNNQSLNLSLDLIDMDAALVAAEGDNEVPDNSDQVKECFVCESLRLIHRSAHIRLTTRSSSALRFISTRSFYVHSFYNTPFYLRFISLSSPFHLPFISTRSECDSKTGISAARRRVCWTRRRRWPTARTAYSA